MKEKDKEATQHVRLLLAHIEVCREAERILDEIAVTYRHLLACHASKILCDLPNEDNVDPVWLGKKVFDALHRTCDKTRRVCHYEKQHEDDLVTVVTTALENDSYRDTILRRAQKNDGILDESCLDKRKQSLVKKRREDCAQALYRTHITRAVWKHALCIERTPLECLLLDGRSLVELHVEAKQAIVLMERASETVKALDEPTICRTCGTKTKKGRRVHQESCALCKRVYFCSTFCKEEAYGGKSVLAHWNECDLL